MAKERRTARNPERRSPEHSWFDKMSNTKKDILSILILFALVAALFHEVILNDMLFAIEGDNAAARSWSKAAEHLAETDDGDPLWLPYIFSGMPGFGSLAIVPRNVSYVQAVFHGIGKVIFLNAEMSWMVMHYFLGGIFMFLLARVWKFSHLASLIAAVTFMLAPYSIGLSVAGHGSKLMALSYIPLVFLLTHSLMERRDLLSFGLLSAVVGTLFLTNHVQIVYYAMMLIGLYVLYQIALDARTNLMGGLQKLGLFLPAIVVGFAVSSYIYLSVQEYAQYSIRGGGGVEGGTGLQYDYATNWSFHPFESMNFLIPSFFGFQSPYYWGWMPFTESSVYIGIVPLVLGLVALVYYRHRVTIFLALFSLLILMLSFGKHFPIIFNLFFDYLPYFNKFRAPAMILHLMPFTFGLLAAYGFTFFAELWSREKEVVIAKLRKGILVALGAIGVLLLLGVLAKGGLFDVLSGFMFEKEGEIRQFRQQFGAQAPQVLAQVKQTRFDMLWSDFVKFALIAGAALGLLTLYLKRTIHSTMLGFGLLGVLIVDLFIINANFIHPKPKADAERRFAPDPTVQFLKTDTSLYRIFPIGPLFQDNTWMYHTIESIGGYSPAKLRIYQDVLDSCLFRGWDPMFPINMNVVNMLNTKYIIAQGRLPEDQFTMVHFDQAKNMGTHLNPSHLPRAWIVDDIIVARNKRETLNLLNSPTFDPRTMAILEKEPRVRPMKQDSTHVHIRDHRARRIELEVYASAPALMVLSEIYYPAGWRAYVDGEEVEIYRANYILRSISLPGGSHRVEFIFDPPIYRAGMIITHTAWTLVFLLTVIGLWRNAAVRAFVRRAVQQKRNAAN